MTDNFPTWLIFQVNYSSNTSLFKANIPSCLSFSIFALQFVKLVGLKVRDYYRLEADINTHRSELTSPHSSVNTLYLCPTKTLLL